MINLLNPHGIRKEPRCNAKDIQEYVTWIASHNCMICGFFPVECSHTIPKSAGNKGSAILLLPICYKCHREGAKSIHGLGSVEEFQRVHNVNFNDAVWQFIDRYLEERGVKLADRLVLFLENEIKEATK